MLMLFIDDDESERIDRRKDRRARANDDARATLSNFVPLIVPFSRGKMRVQHGDKSAQRSRTKARLELLDGLRRERNLRHEHDGAFPSLQCVGDGLKIDFRFARTGNAMERSE